MKNSNSSRLKAKKRNLEIKDESKIKPPRTHGCLDSTTTTTRRRSERLSKSVACTNKSRSLNSKNGQSLIMNKVSRPRCSAARRKATKSCSKKLSDKESSESEIQDDTDNDDDWKPDADSQYVSELESVGSLDDFRSIPPDVAKLKENEKVATHLSCSSNSRTTAKHVKMSRRSNKKYSRSTDITVKSNSSDSDDPSEWEEVDDKIIPEADYLKDLLDPIKSLKNGDSVSPLKAPLSLEVPVLFNSKKVTKKDPKVLEQMAKKRRLRELYYSMHLTHLLCYLAYTRRINKTCDSPLYRALGLSLLSHCKVLFNEKGEFFEKSKWGKEHLEACIISILTKQDPAILNRSKFEETTKSTLLFRLRENRANETDCTVLLVAALRALAFDVRIVIGINPCPIRPDSSFAISSITSAATKGNKTQKSKFFPVKINRQIISSSETDDISDSEKLKCHNKSKTKELKKLGIFTFAEVFLPSVNQWIVVDPSPPNGYVGKLGSNQSWLYCIGITSTFPVDSDSFPYVGRNPVDLAARYDPHWCIRSRLDRLPSEKWTRLLDFQRLFFDRDASASNTILDSMTNPITYQRDLYDDRAVREKLLSEPIPERLTDLKNHPLYVLPSHLLKYQVIYPVDAIPLGFFKNEPIYSRDCVKLCHNRESWLKEAMVVRPHEKPIKIVKARPSLKRRLLQGYDDKPSTVELFGPWQVEPYKPPTAVNGIVPRGPHGTVDLFKPCMLPIGCAHICLTGIQHIAKKLGVDCVPAVVGWTFHGAGWAHPKQEGYIVCKEFVPSLVDAWRQTQMNAAKAAAEDRAERALENWRRLVRGLFLWNRVKAQFALAPLHSNPSDGIRSSGKPKRSTKTQVKVRTSQQVGHTINPDVSEKLHDNLPTVDSCLDNVSSEGWQRLSQLNEVCLTTIPIPVLEPVKKKPKRDLNKRTKTKRRRKRTSSLSSSEVSQENIPISDDNSSSDFV